MGCKIGREKKGHHSRAIRGVKVRKDNAQKKMDVKTVIARFNAVIDFLRLVRDTVEATQRCGVCGGRGSSTAISPKAKPCKSCKGTGKVEVVIPMP